MEGLGWEAEWGEGFGDGEEEIFLLCFTITKRWGEIRAVIAIVFYCGQSCERIFNPTKATRDKRATKDGTCVVSPCNVS